MNPFRLTTLLLVAAVAPLTSAEDVATPREAPEPSRPEITVEHRTNRAHFLGLRADFGSRKEVGIGYLHAHESETRAVLGSYVWFGYGTDLRLVVGRRRVDALLGYAVGRMSGITDAGPCGLELALGAGRGGGGGVQAAGSAGIFFSAYYFELGYAFQFPMGPFHRPDWLGAHFFSLRAHVPVYRYDRKAETFPR